MSLDDFPITASWVSYGFFAQDFFIFAASTSAGEIVSFTIKGQFIKSIFVKVVVPGSDFLEIEDILIEKFLER